MEHVAVCYIRPIPFEHAKKWISDYGNDVEDFGIFFSLFWSDMLVWHSFWSEWNLWLNSSQQVSIFFWSAKKLPIRVSRQTCRCSFSLDRVKGRLLTFHWNNSRTPHNLTSIIRHCGPARWRSTTTSCWYSYTEPVKRAEITISQTSESGLIPINNFFFAASRASATLTFSKAIIYAEKRRRSWRRKK